MPSYLDTRLGSLPRTGTFVQSLGSFNTLAELNATHPANNYNPGTTAYTVDQGFMISDGSVWESPGMVPGEEDVTAATYAAARLLSGAATGARLQVRGRTSQSDGGQGLFTWVAGGSTTINDGSQLTAPGGIWQRPDVTLNAQWYGIDPTGVTASDVALNLAIQDAIIQKKKLVLPSGIFLLNNPLFCFVSGGGQMHIDIEGQGAALAGGPSFPGIPRVADYRANTILLVNYNDKPGIIFQNNRYPSLKRISIIGLNTTAFNGPTIPTNSQSDYVLAGCATGAQSPYCGIAIDPFRASLPADGGYAGLSSYYGPAPSGSGSTGIRFEEVFISQFVVGIGAGTSSVSQGDEMSFINCDIKFCDAAFACGNSQARGNIFSGGSIANCRTAFDTLNYAVAGNSGCNPILIEKMLMGHLYQIIAMNAGSPTTIRGCYAESISSIGIFGKSPANSSPIMLEGNQWSIADSQFSGHIPPLVLESYGPTVIKANRIQSELDRDVYNIICASGGGGAFEQCAFSGSAYTNLPAHIAIDANGTNASRFQDCLCTGTAGTIPISDTFTRRFGISSLAVSGRFRATQQTRWVTDGATQYNYQPRTTVPYIAIGTSANITIVGTTLTFTESTLGELQVNDILMWRMLAQGFSTTQYIVPAWKIATIDGSGNCVANALWDIALYDTVVNNAASLGANVVDPVLHQWAPSTALTGNTHSNTTLDTLSTNALINGDWVQGVGIPVRTRVVSGGGTSSVVLSKAATSTLTGINLYDGQLVSTQLSGTYFPSQLGNTGAAPVPTFTNGALQAWTLSASTTWGAPTGAWVAGNRLTLLVTSTGAFTTAWNAVYRNAPAWAVAANAQKATAEFMYDGANWQFIGGSTAFA